MTLAPEPVRHAREPAPHPPIQPSGEGPGAAEAPATPRQWRDQRTAEVVEALRTCSDPVEDADLRQQLIAVNMPVASLLARRYRNRGESDEDLEQVALVGLSEAARRFDPAVASSFQGFFMPTVLGELRRHFRDRGWVVRPPRRLQELQLRVMRAETELSHTLLRDPTSAEVASLLGRDVAEVEEAMTLRSCYTPASLDRPVGEEDDSPGLGELMPVPDEDRPAAEARVLLAPAIRELSDRDRRVLRLRFFDGLTQREIAEDVGVTQMQISRVLTRIFADLRQAIGAV